MASFTAPMNPAICFPVKFDLKLDQQSNFGSTSEEEGKRTRLG